MNEFDQRDRYSYQRHDPSIEEDHGRTFRGRHNRDFPQALKTEWTGKTLLRCGI